jgi:hypothetical protein
LVIDNSRHDINVSTLRGACHDKERSFFKWKDVNASYFFFFSFAHLLECQVNIAPVQDDMLVAYREKHVFARVRIPRAIFVSVRCI